jgi:hypothetical protein
VGEIDALLTPAPQPAEISNPGSVDTTSPLTFSEIVAWANAGATTPELIIALHHDGITPADAARPVAGPDGNPTTIAAALEQGAIPPYDAAAVCATWPGRGWCYHPDRFAWATRIDPDTLAGIARRHATIDDIDDQPLGARMAAELSRQAPRHIGIDLIVAPTSRRPTRGWDDGLPPELFAAAAAATADAIANPARDPLAGYANRWLSGELDVLAALT